MQYLFIDPARNARLGVRSPTSAERLTICRDFAELLTFLHEHNTVIGDINAKNALFRTDDRPTVMLVDCDAIRIKGSMAVVRQLNTADWVPPEGAVLSQPTDVYKFGLFVLRSLSPGAGSSTNRDTSVLAGVLDDEGVRLLEATLGKQPRSRPTASDWSNYLADAQLRLRPTRSRKRLWPRSSDHALLGSGPPVPRAPEPEPGPADSGLPIGLDNLDPDTIRKLLEGMDRDETPGWRRNPRTGRWERP